MKYLFLKNKIQFKSSILKFYLMQLLFIFIYILTNGSAIAYFDLEKYSYILGLGSINGANIFDILIKIITYLIIIYLIVKVFVDSINNTMEYIMIRINKNRWIFLEIINFIFYIVMMRVILNLITFSCFSLFGSNIEFTSYIYVMAIDLFFTINMLLLITLSLNLLCLENGKNLSAFIPIFIIFASLFKNSFNISFSFYIISVIILIIINVRLFSPTKFYNRYCTK